MDDLVVLWKIEEVKRIKGKDVYEELIVRRVQTKAVLRLMKAKLLIETVVAGETISKEKLTSEIKLHHPQNGRFKINSKNSTLL
jgi:hypothetical protein